MNKKFVYIYKKNKLTQTFKIIFGLWFTNVFEFHGFLILIKLIFEFQIIFEN